MNFYKCKRCGGFFSIEGQSCCPSCIIKDNNEISNLNSFITENNNNPMSVNELSSITGVSTNNISRYITSNKLNLN